MERKLRRRFVFISTLATFIALLILTMFVNYLSTRYIIEATDIVMDLIIENNGEIPKEFEMPPKPDTRFEGAISEELRHTTRYFYADVSEDEIISNINLNNISEGAQEEAYKILDNVISEIDFSSNEEKSGYLDNYIYKIIDTGAGKRVLFVNSQAQLFALNVISTLLSGLSLVILILVFILSCVFSKKAVAPIVNAQERQKEFITNVSHELKTPLAIIKANTEVMEVIEGKTDWTSSNHKQVERLNKLVSYLVSLTKFEEKKNDKIKIEFSLSDAVKETAENFRTVANDKNIILNIDKNISFVGDEDSIRMMFSTLFDNAVKYSLENTDIEVTLAKKKNKAYFTIKNKADNLEQGNYDKLFERFYKEDKVRNSNSNSFGIGLSIAKTIIENHKGNITAKSEDGKSLTFIVTL